MSDEAELKDAIAHLDATLKSGSLPKAQVSRGEALLDRLRSPVHLTLFGLPGSGKTALANLLLGERILPEGTAMPTTELVWGTEPKARIVMADGQEHRFAWPVDKSFDWDEAVFVKVTHPAPVLRKISILEIVTDGSPQDMSGALNWAIPRTDVSLWCTQSFNKLENALWVQVPDSLKDHGYLVATRADELTQKGVLPDTIKRLSGVVQEEFQQLFAVATTQYLAAMTPEGVPENVRRASGGGTITDTIHGHVNSGRQADLDGALIFLGKFGIPEDQIAKHTDLAKPNTETKADQKATADAAAEAKLARRKISIDLAATKPPAREETPLADVEEAPKVEAEPAEVDGASQTDQTASTPEWNDQNTVSQALDIVANSLEALDVSDEDDDALSDEVLQTCADAVDQMVGLVADSGTESPALSDELEEAYEMLVLMQLEQGVSSAADAATVLLQVKRDLIVANAA